MNKKILIIILIGIVIISFAFYLFKIGKMPFLKNSPSGVMYEAKPVEWGNPEEVKTKAEIVASELNEASINYINNLYKISLNYPQGFTVSELNEDDIDIVLIQDAQNNIGLQISGFEFIDPIETLTKERVQSDLGLEINNYSIIKVGINSDIQAITFLSSEIGSDVLNREVWIIHNKKLIQFKGYSSSEPLIVAILKTLSVI